MTSLLKNMVMACCIPGILFSAPVLSPVKSPAKYKTDTIEQSPPVLTYKQLHEQWEQLVGDTAKSDSALTAKSLKKDSLLSTMAGPSDKTSTVDSSKRKVLLLTGDSMISCLSWYLEKNCSLLGYETQVVPFICSTTEFWAKSKFLSRLIHKYRPCFIIICLGSNEFFLGSEKVKKRGGYISSILKENDSTPLVWIGPPNLEDTKELDTVISVRIGSGRYFCTSDLILDRQQDNRHPSASASNAWSDSVCRWIQNTSDYKITMLPPGSQSKSYYIRNNYAAIARARIKTMADSTALAKADSIAAPKAFGDAKQQTYYALPKWSLKDSLKQGRQKRGP